MGTRISEEKLTVACVRMAGKVLTALRENRVPSKRVAPGLLRAFEADISRQRGSLHPTGARVTVTDEARAGGRWALLHLFDIDPEAAEEGIMADQRVETIRKAYRTPLSDAKKHIRSLATVQLPGLGFYIQ